MFSMLLLDRGMTTKSDFKLYIETINGMLLKKNTHCFLHMISTTNFYNACYAIAFLVYIKKHLTTMQLLDTL